MKAKPDTTAFSPEERRKRDAAERGFIEGGAADVAERGAGQAAEVAPQRAPAEPAPLPQASTTPQVLTVQKLFRMRKDTSDALQQLALDLKKSTGRRVTETEIVEELVRTRCGLPAISK